MANEGPPTLSEVPDLWKDDGGLRDIYVVGTARDDWKRFIALAASYPCSYEFDGVSASLPEVEGALQDHEHTHLLSIQVGNARLNCHFFIIDEIEIDIDPREIRSSADHDGVLNFVRELGRALGKPIVMTPENEIETPIISYQPSNDTWKWKADWSPLVVPRS